MIYTNFMQTIASERDTIEAQKSTRRHDKWKESDAVVKKIENEATPTIEQLNESLMLLVVAHSKLISYINDEGHLQSQAMVKLHAPLNKYDGPPIKEHKISKVEGLIQESLEDAEGGVVVRMLGREPSGAYEAIVITVSETYEERALGNLEIQNETVMAISPTHVTIGVETNDAEVNSDMFHPEVLKTIRKDFGGDLADVKLNCTMQMGESTNEEWQITYTATHGNNTQTYKYEVQTV